MSLAGLKKRRFEHEIIMKIGNKTSFVVRRRRLHLLAGLLPVAAAAAGNAGLGHVALEDALLDVGGVVLLALLGVEAAEDDTLDPLVEFGAEEEKESGDEDNSPLPVRLLVDVPCV